MLLATAFFENLLAPIFASTKNDAVCFIYIIEKLKTLAFTER